jgi:hypothetical protein
MSDISMIQCMTSESKSEIVNDDGILRSLVASNRSRLATFSAAEAFCSLPNLCERIQRIIVAHDLANSGLEQIST